LTIKRDGSPSSITVYGAPHTGGIIPNGDFALCVDLVAFDVDTQSGAPQGQLALYVPATSIILTR